MMITRTIGTPSASVRRGALVVSLTFITNLNLNQEVAQSGALHKRVDISCSSSGLALMIFVCSTALMPRLCHQPLPLLSDTSTEHCEYSHDLCKKCEHDSKCAIKKDSKGHQYSQCYCSSKNKYFDEKSHK
jgi:hypothetical protein